MKRIYSYVFAAVAVFTAVSCQKENVIDAPEVNEEAFAITAVANADTKTVLNGLKTYWTPTDALTTFDATGANRKFTTDITENSASARFTTPTFVLPNDLSTAKLLAVYPYTEGATTDFQTKVSGLEIPATQQAVAGGFDPDATLAYVLDGVANQHNLKFNNVYGLFEFTVKNDNVKKVTVKANGGEKIAGPVELLLNGTLMPAAGAVSEVTLEGNFVNGSTYYVALIPGTYASGITVSFDDEEVKSTTKSITLAKNQIRGMGELHQPQASEWAVAGTFNDWGDMVMYTTSTSGLFVAKEVACEAYTDFKIKKKASGKNDGWDTNYGVKSINYLNSNVWVSVQSGSGTNLSIVNEGTYDIYFDFTNSKVYVVAAGADYTTASEQTTNGEAPVISNARTIYLKAGPWTADGAWFIAYTWGGATSAAMLKLEASTKGSGIYECEIPNDRTNIIFLRKNPANQQLSWDGEWSRFEMVLPSDKNCFTVNASWGDGGWSNI